MQKDMYNTLRRKSRYYQQQEAQEAESVGQMPADDLMEMLPRHQQQLESAVVSHLIQRWEQEETFTALSQRHLIYLNPFEDTQANQYSDEYVQSYHENTPGSLPPHIYDIAERIRLNIRQNKVEETLLMITGESASGKSFMTWKLVEYLAQITSSQMAQKVQDIQTIINWTIRSRTLLNGDATRASVRLTCYLNSDYLLCGLLLKVAALETSRVSSKPVGEYNYHIFYGFISYLSSRELKAFGLTSSKIANYLMLYDSTLDSLEVPKEQFQDFQNAMLRVMGNISTGWKQVIAAILHLGNLDMSNLESDDSIYALHYSSQLIGLPSDALAQFLWTDAKRMKHTLMNVLYDMLVNHIISRLNLYCAPTRINECYRVYLFDVPGFEIFQRNHLIQLRTNFQNEYIHYLLNRNIFTQAQEDAVEDGIRWEPVSFYENQICITLLKDGLIPMIASVTSRQDVKQLFKQLNPTFIKNKHYFEASEGFGVCHFATDVSYTLSYEDLMYGVAVQMEAVSSIVKTSKSRDIRQIAGSLQSIRNTLEDTLQFMEGISSLCQTSEVYSVRCIKPNHFLRPGEVDREFIASQVAYLNLPELLFLYVKGYCAHNWSYVQFYKQFDFITYTKNNASLLKSKGRKHFATMTDLQPKCVDIIQFALDKFPDYIAESKQNMRLFQLSSLDDEIYEHLPLYQLGTAKVWVTNSVYIVLQYLVNEKLELYATNIQKVWRGFKVRKLYKNQMKRRTNAAVQIQRAVRGNLAKRIRNLMPIVTNAPPLAKVGTDEFQQRKALPQSITNQQARQGDSSNAISQQTPSTLNDTVSRPADAQQGTIYNAASINVFGRRFVCKGSVWEVVNNNLVKERSLFLFNDILVVAKELKTQQSTQFEIKSVVNLKQMTVRLNRDEDPAEALLKSEIMTKAVQRFDSNPKKGLTYLIEKGILHANPSSVAEFLYRTPVLNRFGIGRFLTTPDNREILKEYLQCFDFRGLRLDEALRLFFGAFRPPGESHSMDALLSSFSSKYQMDNSSIISNADLSLKLVFGLLMLNAEVHRVSEDDDDTRITATDFVERLRAQDVDYELTDDYLIQLYTSIQNDKLAVAANQDEDTSKKRIVVNGLPFRVSMRDKGCIVQVTIEHPDPGLVIQIFTHKGLKCTPDTLDFSVSATVSFRLTGIVAGRKSISMLKLGENSRSYSSQYLPFNKMIVVEPPFMKHVFQLKAKVRDPSTRRKVSYMFSVANRDQRDNWANQLENVLGALDQNLLIDYGLPLDSGEGLLMIQNFVVQRKGAYVVPSMSDLQLD